MADRWTARSASRKLLDQALGWLTPDERDELRVILAAYTPDQVALALQAMRKGAMAHLQVPPRARRVLFDTLSRRDRLLASYAAAAWSCRTLVLFERLERSPLEPGYPAKWAGDAALRLIDEFEEEQVWLWPFDDQTPWPDTEEDGED